MRSCTNADEWVRSLREQLKLTGFPTDPEAWQMVALLQREGRIEVDVGSAPGTGARYTAAGVWLISLAATGTERERTLAVLEEVGHYLMEDACPAWLPPRKLGKRRLRLLLAQDRKDEGAAQRFVLAWLLPLDLMVLAFGNEELLAHAPATPEQIAQRWAMLQ